MSMLALAAKQLRENRLRNALTVIAVAIAVLGFLIMRTFIWSWTIGARVAAQDRIVTRHKVTFFQPMPRRYFDEVVSVQGLEASTYALWSGARSPKDESAYFPALAVDADTFTDVFDEMSIPPAQKQAWLANRQGALVGMSTATKLGWKVGDRVRLVSGRFPDPGEWEFTIEAIYESKRKSLEQSWFAFHYDYFNATLPEGERDQINWVTSRIADASQSANVSKAIDAHFDVRDTQTLTMSQGAAQTSFLGMVSAVLSAMQIVSMVILGIMVLVLGNTIAMGVRARTSQYAVLRAIGFRPREILFSVIAEGTVIGTVGGSLGLALSYPFVNKGLGRFIEENMGSYFPYFHITPELAIVTFALVIALGASAALLPARSVLRLDVVHALRRVQ